MQNNKKRCKRCTANSTLSGVTGVVLTAGVCASGQAFADDYTFKELTQDATQQSLLNNVGHVAWTDRNSESLYLYDGDSREEISISSGFAFRSLFSAFFGGSAELTEFDLNDNSDLAYLSTGGFSPTQIFTYRDGTTTEAFTAGLTVFDLSYDNLNLANSGLISYRANDRTYGQVEFHEINNSASVLVHELDSLAGDMFAVNDVGQFAVADTDTSTLLYYNGDYVTTVTTPVSADFSESGASLDVNNNGEIVWVARDRAVSGQLAVYYYDGGQVTKIHEDNSILIEHLSINDDGAIAWKATQNASGDISVLRYADGSVSTVAKSDASGLDSLIINTSGQLAWLETAESTTNASVSSVFVFDGNSSRRVASGTNVDLLGFNDPGQLLVLADGVLSIGTPDEEVSADNVEIDSVNDWYTPGFGGGFIVNYRVTLTEDDVSGQGSDLWAFEPNYVGSGVIGSGWVSGYGGPVSTGNLASDGGYAITSSENGFRQDLRVGDSFVFSVLVRDAGFKEADFNPMFTNLTPGVDQTVTGSDVASVDFTVASVGSWYNNGQGGYNVILNVPLTAALLSDPTDFGWTATVGYAGDGQIRTGWVDGFPGGVSIDVRDANTIVYSNETQGYQPPLAVGDVISLAITVDNAPFDVADFSISFSQ